MIAGFFLFRSCVKILFSLDTISIFILTRGCPEHPSTPSPPEIRLTPSADIPYPQPLPTPGPPPRHPPGPLRPEPQTRFLKNENVTRFTVFPYVTPSHHTVYTVLKQSYASTCLCIGAPPLNTRGTTHTSTYVLFRTAHTTAVVLQSL